MKTFIAALLLSTAAFAQVQIEPNQTCKGIGQNDEVVSTKLFLATSEDKNVFDAQLEIEVNGKQKMALGTLTKKSDLMGARMFKNNDDSIRYLTSGSLFDLDSETFVNGMKCTKLKL